MVEYNYTIQKAKCSCNVKISLPLIEDIKFDKEKLYNSFTDIKNIANLNLMKCYKVVFTKESLVNNYGSFYYVLLLLFFFILLFIFYCKYYSSLIKTIKEIKEAKINIIKNEENKVNKLITDNNKKKKIITKAQKVKKTKVDKSKQKKDITFSQKKQHKKDKAKNIELNNSQQLKESALTKNIKISNANFYIFNNKKNIKKKNKQIQDNYFKYKEILKYNDNELNSLTYKQAIKSDKRTYCQYYLSLLKIGHLLMFSFYCNNRDYNVQIIKIFLFFFFFAVHFTINALFFNDKTMHKIYIDEGSYNFIYQIPQIIYSSLISIALDIIIKYLSLSESDILRLKGQKKIETIDATVKRLIRTLKIKFVLFFMVTFFLILLFAYYIICFCGIYDTTQIHLIKDSLISIGLCLIYPFGMYLIPGIFRLPALNAKVKIKNIYINLLDLSKIYCYKLMD